MHYRQILFHWGSLLVFLATFQTFSFSQPPILRVNSCVLECSVASVASNSLQLHGPARLLCPWASPDKNAGMSCHILLQGTFLTQESNLFLLCLVFCIGRWVLYHYHHLGSPVNSLYLLFLLPLSSFSVCSLDVHKLLCICSLQAGLSTSPLCLWHLIQMQGIDRMSLHSLPVPSIDLT